MRTDIGTTAEDAGQRAARLLGAVLAVAVRKRGRAILGLSGGRTPAPLYGALARQPLDWPAIHVFQVDERVAERGSDVRNLTAIEDAFVVRGALPAGNLHPMRVERADLASAAAGYGVELRDHAGDPPVLDAIHLGIGADGHTASLFAADPALQAASDAVAVTGEQAGYQRLTMTLPVINQARSVIWFITGADKAELAAELLQGGAPFPAARVSRRRAVVVMDAAAAAMAKR